MTTSRDIADYILRTTAGVMPLSRLNALIYVAQGWSLALRDCPLFEEDMRAGARGPYLPMFQMVTGADPLVGYQWISGDSSALTEEEAAHLDKMLGLYEDIPDDQLREELTRSGTPWTLTLLYGRGDVIEMARLRDFYRDRMSLVNGEYLDME